MTKAAAIRRRLARRTDWIARFEAEMRRAAERPFRYGRHDCCLCAVAFIRAITGVDVARGLRGYRGERGAAEMRRRYGGVPGLARRVAARFGLERVPPLMARRGDAVLIRGADREYRLGIVALDGRQVLVADRPRGIAAVPLDASICIAAWRIG